MMKSISLAKIEILKAIDWSTIQAESDGRRYASVATTGATPTGYATHDVTIQATQDTDGTVDAVYFVGCGVKLDEIEDSTPGFVSCLRCNPLQIRDGTYVEGKYQSDGLVVSKALVWPPPTSRAPGLPGD